MSFNVLIPRFSLLSLLFFTTNLSNKGHLTWTLLWILLIATTAFWPTRSSVLGICCKLDQTRLSCVSPVLRLLKHHQYQGGVVAAGWLYLSFCYLKIVGVTCHRVFLLVLFLVVLSSHSVFFFTLEFGKLENNAPDSAAFLRESHVSRLIES